MEIKSSSHQELKFQSVPHPLLKVSVVVPAKDEASYIKKTLNALRTQIDDMGEPLQNECYEVLILANNCSDDTYEICKDYQTEYPEFRIAIESIQIPKSLAHIGTVRRMLMDAAYERLMNVTGEKGIIVSTDADTEVDPQWIFQIIQEIENGVDVVGGRILSKDTPSLSRMHHLRDVTYRFLKAKLECEIDPCKFNPWPRHHQCFGASLAVTCEMYERGGRLPIVPYLEDEAFRIAVNRIDAKIRHSPKVLVYTSSRLLGKVDVGFSGQLKEWETMSLNNQQQLEESFESVKLQFVIKNHLRKAWIASMNDNPIPTLVAFICTKTGLDQDQLSSILTKHKYFESLWETFHNQWIYIRPETIQMKPVIEAIVEFRQHFAKNLS